MPDYVNAALTLLATPAAVASILAQAELWQRKEYRLDRLRAALFGPELRLRLLLYAAALALALVGLSPAAILIGAADRAQLLLKRGLLRPDWTLKASLLVVLSVIMTGAAAVALAAFLGIVPALAAAVLLPPPAAAGAVVVVNLIAAMRKRTIVQRARRLRLTLPELTVIGVTGSYGKTSTKHFLGQLLPHAAVSGEHRNAEFPIAQDLLEQLPRHPSTYIVEMAAYRRGEVAALARLAAPSVGIITAIGNQHLATFGSRENILCAKWELISALPAHGTAVLNADDSTLRQAAADRAAASVIWYSTSQPADVYADDIVVEPATIRCRLHIGQAVQSVTIPLAGRGALNNVVAAAAAAKAAGASDQDVFSRLPCLKPFPRTMEIRPGAGGATVIDDSYSANERSVLDAIAHLALFPHHDKRIALLPLIELGEDAAPVHRRIGEALQRSRARVFVYGKAFSHELGVGQGTVHAVTSPSALAEVLTVNAGPDTLLLLEGRIPELARQAALAAERPR